MSSRQMDKGARLWLLKYARKNYWRVAAWIDLEDLIQDGFAAYYETLMRYPTAKDAAHIMRLFQLVFRSKIEDLVRAHKKQIDSARSDIIENVDSSPTLSTILPDFSNFHALLVKAPQQIKDALNMLNSEHGRQELIKPFVRQENGRRETLNERWCSLLGYDPKQVDVVTMLRSYFSTI